MGIATATNYRTQVAGLAAGAPVRSEAVRGLEDALGVQLPDEFARICEFYESCDLASGYLARVSAEPKGNTIVALTQRLRREQNLPVEYVVLGAADNSVLLLTGSMAPCEWGPVYEIPRKALPAFTRGQTPLGTHRWSTFVDFFADAIGIDRTLEIQGQWSLRAWEASLRRAPAEGALLSIDVDGFVHVNQVLQRSDGDQTLRDCAELLKEFLPAGSLVAGWRKGTVMAHVRDASKALDVAEQFRQAVERTWAREHARIRESSRQDDQRFNEALLAVSIGVAAYDGDVARSTRAADEASFDAKGRGLNQVVDART